MEHYSEYLQGFQTTYFARHLEALHAMAVSRPAATPGPGYVGLIVTVNSGALARRYEIAGEP